MITSEEKGLYWLIGSQQFPFNNCVCETLAGRAAIVDMYPLSITEKTNAEYKVFDPDNIEKKPLFKVQDIFKEIYKGGMPEYYNNNTTRNDFLVII